MPTTSLDRKKDMPTFDVHQRRLVRIKVAGVEAIDHRDAIAKLSTDDYLRDIEKAVNMDKDTGTVRSVQIEDDEAPTSYTVDVCGDDQYRDTLYFDVVEEEDAGVLVLSTPRTPGPPSKVLTTALEAAGVRPPGSIIGIEELAKGDPVAALVLSETDGLASAEHRVGWSRLDDAITRLTKARDAIASMEATRRENYDAQ